MLNMRKPESWAGELEILAASYVLEAPIEVLTIVQGRVKRLPTFGGETYTEPPMQLLFSGHDHYDLVIEKSRGAPDKYEEI